MHICSFTNFFRKNEISSDKLDLLRSTSSIGKKETLRDKYERAMKQKAAGLELSVDPKDIERFENRANQEFVVTKGLPQQVQEEFYYAESSDEDDEENAVPEEEAPKDPTTVEKIIAAPTRFTEDFQETNSNVSTTKLEEPKKQDVFMTLDFGFGAPSSKPKDTAPAKKATKPASDDEDEQENDEVGDENTEQGEEEETDNVEQDGENEDGDEELTWKERVCKGFEELIDKISEKVKDEELQKELIMDVTKLLDVVIPEDSDDEEADDMEGENMDAEADGETITPAEPFNYIKLSQGAIDPSLIVTDTKLIKTMLDDKDKSKTEEEKSIRYTKYFVPVDRTPEIQETRLNLPVCAEEQPIMETITHNAITIICGETGSGKTTQVPQFLYEAGLGDDKSGFPGMIGVTQPRRVAAISTAKRVAEELNVEFGTKVAYQVRYDGNVSQDTKIKFMTDGILLREIQNDPLLMRYSAIVLDEAHERNVNTDILIGWLSRFIPQRNKMAEENKTTPDGVKITPLKLIVMSATLRVEDFTANSRLFSIPPPVINIQSRQYPVTVHFNKKTVFTDYVGASFKKICRIHEKLPSGGILVFLTGRQEIDFIVNKLRQYSAKNPANQSKALIAKKKAQQTSTEAQTDEQTEEDVINELGDLSDEDNDDGDDEEELETSRVLFEDNISSEKLKQQGQENNKRLNKKKVGSLYVLPLYSMLQPKQQLKVFQPPPEGSRLCIIATNVAETSLTIPGIRYVIDAGRVKDKKYDRSTGVTKFEVQWTSKASSDQRAGRSGRTGPGHCYRLFSSAVYDQQFKQHTDPDILRTPIESLVLQMKTMGIKNVIKFPFPTPPEEDALKDAVKTLKCIGALDKNDAVTELGSSISNFPVHPRFGKMLLLGQQSGVLSYVTSIVSALTVQELFTFDHILQNLRFKAIKSVNDEDVEDETDAYLVAEGLDGANAKSKKAHLRGLTEKERELQKRCQDSKSRWAHPDSDHLTFLRAVGAYEYEGARDEFCTQHLLHIKNMREIHKLRKQLNNIMEHATTSTLDMDDIEESTKAEGSFVPPNQEQEITIRQIICAGFIDQVARLATDEDLNTMEVDLSPHNPVRPYVTLSLGLSTPVFIHPSSFMSKKQPQYLVYTEVFKGRSTRTFIKGVTIVQPAWLSTFGAPMTTIGKPLEEPAPRYNDDLDMVTSYHNPSFGHLAWTLPTMEQKHPIASTQDQAKVMQIFCKFLLDGQVFVDLAFYKDKLQIPATEFLKIVSLPPRCKQMIDKLLEKKVQPTKQALLAQWKQEPTFLFKEFQTFLKTEFKSSLHQKWPPSK